jgi:hypothetical protein
MEQRPTTKEASERSVEKTRASEVDLAEQRGAEQVRRQLRELVQEHRRVVRQGEAQVEVVEISALQEILDRES